MIYVLGLDLGTSSLKGILMDESGNILAEKSRDYPLFTHKSGYSEQNPRDWILACEQLFEDFILEIPTFSDRLVGISFSGQMHSLVVIDEEGQPVYPAILWNDVRTTKECQLIEKALGKDLINITKNRALEGFTLPKILWLKNNEPKVWQKVKKIMLPKDYLSYWLTENINTDYSDAAGTLLLDIENKEWSKSILNKFNLSIDLLPNLVASTTQVGMVNSYLSDKYNFKKPVKVFAGGADNACAALGAGLNSEEIGLVSVGTSGVFSTFEKEVKDYQGKLHVFNHALPNNYYSMGVTLAAGNSLQWFKETFAKELSFSELLKPITKIDPGSAGLYFTPYIVGERTPHFDSQIRGSFIGIDTQHELPHFTRAVLEGITFSLKDSQQIMEQERKQKFQKLISVGGGAKNPIWLQMQADIFDVDIIQLTVEQGPGLGACMIAAVGCQLFDDIQSAIDACVFYEEKHYKPIKENVKYYKQVYEQWQKIYQCTKEIKLNK